MTGQLPEPPETNIEASYTPSLTDAAIAAFATGGFHQTSLDDIARRAKMDPHALATLYGNKEELYRQALVAAIENLRVPAESIEIDSEVPVEGIRKIINAMASQFLSHPREASLLIYENVCKNTDLSTLDPVGLASSELLTSLTRLLLVGQDSGAFRPGISPTDIMALIYSMLFFRANGNRLFHAFYDVDMYSPANAEGFRRAMVDTVLAFLTANIPNSGRESYLARTIDENTSTSAAYDPLASNIFATDN